MRGGASVIHLNVVNFSASAEALREPSLREEAFAVAVPKAARAVILDVSRPALREGILPGMRVEEALRAFGGLRIVAPSPGLYAEVNKAIERVCAAYAPLLENSGGGHFYLDLRGTRGLFGEYMDAAAKIRNEVADRVGLDAATALAANKLVAKVGTRSLRPDGFVSVREGDERAFLNHQDLGFLPGVEGRTGRILDAVGIREIGELASLSDEEVRGLLGGEGLALREGARGLDPRPVQDGELRARVIERRIRFDSEVLEGEALLAALGILVEKSGFELRRDRLATRSVGVDLVYADEVGGRAWWTGRQALTLDGELGTAARAALARAHTRRLRVAVLGLVLARLEPASPQLELFGTGRAFPRSSLGDEEPGRGAGGLGRAGGSVRAETDGDLLPAALERGRRIQDAVDAARRRWGQAALTRGTSLAAAAFHDV